MASLRNIFVLVTAVLTIGCVSGCSTSHPDSQQEKRASADNTPEKIPIPFKGTLHIDNPLIGHFWSVRENRLVSWKDVLEQIHTSDWLLLGESHGVIDHQKMEDVFIQVLDRSDRLGAVAFEQFSEEQQPLISPWLGKGNEVSGHNLAWHPDSWDWNTYVFPLSSALNGAKQVLALDPSRERVQQVYQDSKSAKPLSGSYSVLMDELIRQSHCNLLPDSMIGPMINVQSAKDRFMADVLNSATTPGETGIAIMGYHHARKDYGVPLWLANDVSSTSILLQQVTASADPSSYIYNPFEGREIADYIMFTPGHESPDYCEQLKAGLSYHQQTRQHIAKR